jgi:hypothetical protein
MAFRRPGLFSFWEFDSMKLTLARTAAGLGVGLAILCSASLSYGQAKIPMSEDRWVSLGGGLRTSFRSTQTAPGGSYGQTFSLDSIRLYVNSQLHKDFQVEANTEYGGLTSEFRVLDAVVKYAPNEYFNIWMGRHLTPSDRANLDGPYFLSAYDYPGLVSRYPGIFAGRDNGVSVSGQVQGGQFKYAFGVYEGQPTVLGTGDNMLYAARFVANFLDPEPGYYNASTYYGDKDILAVGFVVQHQANVVNVGGTPGAFTGFNFDLLLEKKLPNDGVATLEGAYYNYDLQDTPGDGEAFLAQGAYLFPQQVGIGKFQPLVRYQDFVDTNVLDIGVNYVIRAHNARLSFTYSRTGLPGSVNTNQFTAGTQFQF